MAYFDENDPIRKALKEKWELEGTGPTITIDGVTGETTLGGKTNPNASDWRKAYSDYVGGGGSLLNTPHGVSSTKMYQHPLFAGGGLATYTQKPYSKGLLADIQGTIGGEQEATTTPDVSDTTVSSVVRQRVSEQQFGDASLGGTGTPPARTAENNFGWLTEDNRKIGNMLSLVSPGGGFLQMGMYANQASAIRAAYGYRYGTTYKMADLAKHSLSKSVREFLGIEEEKDTMLTKMAEDMENRNIAGRMRTDKQGVKTYDYTHSYGDEDTKLTSQQQLDEKSFLDRYQSDTDKWTDMWSKDEAGEEDQFGGFDLSQTPGEDTADVGGTGDVGTGGGPSVGGSNPDDDSGDGDGAGIGRQDPEGGFAPDTGGGGAGQAGDASSGDNGGGDYSEDAGGAYF